MNALLGLALSLAVQVIGSQIIEKELAPSVATAKPTLVCLVKNVHVGDSPIQICGSDLGSYDASRDSGGYRSPPWFVSNNSARWDYLDISGIGKWRLRKWVNITCEPKRSDDSRRSPVIFELDHDVTSMTARNQKAIGIASIEEIDISALDARHVLIGPYRLAVLEPSDQSEHASKYCYRVSQRPDNRFAKGLAVLIWAAIGTLAAFGYDRCRFNE
jgi:hypothetical protein